MIMHGFASRSPNNIVFHEIYLKSGPGPPKYPNNKKKSDFLNREGCSCYYKGFALIDITSGVLMTVGVVIAFWFQN